MAEDTPKLRVRHYKTGQVGTVVDELFLGSLVIVQWDGQTRTTSHTKEELKLLEEDLDKSSAE